GDLLPDVNSPQPDLPARHEAEEQHDGRVLARQGALHRLSSPQRREDPMTWTRRQFITTATAAAGAGLTPGLARPQSPWAQRPSATASSLTFVVWQYGKIYEQIAKQFEDDWGVKLNQIIEPNVEPQVAKLTTMFAAGDQVDVSQSPMQYLASYIDQGIA